jgi:hypothetical protein
VAERSTVTKLMGNDFSFIDPTEMGVCALEDVVVEAPNRRKVESDNELGEKQARHTAYNIACAKRSSAKRKFHADQGKDELALANDLKQ